MYFSTESKVAFSALGISSDLCFGTMESIKVRVHNHAYKDWGIFEPNRPLEGLNMGMYCSKNKFQASEKSTSSTTGKSYKSTKAKSPLSRSHRV